MADRASAARNGTVLAIRRGVYIVESDAGTVKCRAATAMRKKEGRILAGDKVKFTENGIDGGFITELTPRKNRFVRPPVANVDLLAIVVSPKDPEPYLYNVDLLTVIAEKYNVEVAVIVTKSDLGGVENVCGVYGKTPYKVVVTSVTDGKGIDEAKELLSGRTCVLCGASGVGKSSLINAIYPSLKLETGELSEKISRGRNTTRVTELFPVDGGGYLADTPGFTAVDAALYVDIDCKELASLFPDFGGYAGKCRYGDCTHTKEEDCAVARGAAAGEIARSRHESYKKLYYELKSINRYK